VAYNGPFKAAPTSLSPNFGELSVHDPIALCGNRRKALENNQVLMNLKAELTAAHSLGGVVEKA
jgi:hypothetical protein